MEHPGEDREEMAATRIAFDIDTENPEVNVAEATAQLENKEMSELPPLYETIDHLIEHLFSDPPEPDAQVQVEFTYEGYRISLDQDGQATFMKISGSQSQS